MKQSILIIDDDTKLNRLLGDYLERFGYACRSATTAEAGLAEISRKSPDLVILDVMLPGMDGFEVCKRIRREHTLPIIMLTARGDVTDRVVGLELGADDYLPKPFEPRELVARIQSVLRRSAPPPPKDVSVHGPIAIDRRRRSVSVDGRPVELTATEFSLLSLLAKNAGIVLDRDTIVERIKGLDADSFDRAVDVAVSRLRQKLGDDHREPRFIKTVWGAGYLFIAGDGAEDGDA